ncbi:hypothetical protein B5X24_HaOG211721 [Helicoverpa armigera]|nr:hypothetical protein B5X24_HaOG211721 [Helicoverpa armigera]
MDDPTLGGFILPFKPESRPEKLNIIRRVAKKLSQDDPDNVEKAMQMCPPNNLAYDSDLPSSDSDSE